METNKLMKRFLVGGLVAILALFGVCSWSSNALAEDGLDGDVASSLRLSPSGTRLTLKPGEVLEGNAEGCLAGLASGCTVQVTNNGNKAFKYKVYVTPYSVSGSNNELSFSTTTGYTQIARWITIKNSNGEYADEAIFTIEPGETQTVEYRVTIPDDIPGGSQYAVLWAQIMDGEESASGIQTIGQVGSVISGRSSSQTVETAEIVDIDMTRFSLSNNLHAKAKVRNTGNADFVIEYKYTARTFFGKEVHADEGSIAAFPETEYDVAMEWNDAPMLGIFTATFEINAGDQHITETHIVVIMPLVVMILLIFLLTIIIVWIIIMLRKRKERKARKLV